MFRSRILPFMIVYTIVVCILSVPDLFFSIRAVPELPEGWMKAYLWEGFRSNHFFWSITHRPSLQTEVNQYVKTIIAPYSKFCK